MIDINVPRSAFNPVYLPHLDNPTRTQIFFGGSSSGKSVFLAQRDILNVLKGGRNVLVCRQTGKSLRGSVVEEAKKVITQWGLSALFKVNKVDGTITCRNGYQIIFAGLDDVEKLKSLTPAKGVFTDVRVEEATETDRNAIKQLMKRQRGGDEDTAKRLTLSFNPILQSHWIYQDYFQSIAWAHGQQEYSSPDLFILKTTYKDNKFLTEKDIYDLEHETDKYYFNVYTLGNWGVLGNVIFTNWVMADLNDPESEYYLPENLRVNRRNGLDFGFAGHPAAVGVSHYDSNHKIIYIYKELYETGLTNDLLAERVKDMIGDEPITCDSAEPKSIQELCNHGVNAYGAKKGKDSVTHGIDWLKQQTIVVHIDCINARNELQSYKWKEDAGGNALPIPVDKFNHFIDGGLRYAYENDMEAVWLVS